MANENFYFGNLKADADASTHHRWVVGEFMEKSPQRNKAVELKHWEFPKGKGSHPMKTSATLEITLILAGSIRGTVDGQSVTLNAGDYIVISPGTPNNLTEAILEDVIGITIKAPSDINAKKIIR